MSGSRMSVAAAAPGKTPRWDKFHAQTVAWSYDIEGHAQVRREMLWIGKQKDRASNMCSQIVLKCLNVRRICRPVILWSVTTRAATRFAESCEYSPHDDPSCFCREFWGSVSHTASRSHSSTQFWQVLQPDWSRALRPNRQAHANEDSCSVRRRSGFRRILGPLVFGCTTGSNWAPHQHRAFGVAFHLELWMEHRERSQKKERDKHRAQIVRTPRLNLFEQSQNVQEFVTNV